VVWSRTPNVPTSDDPEARAIVNILSHQEIKLRLAPALIRCLPVVTRGFVPNELVGWCAPRGSHPFLEPVKCARWTPLNAGMAVLLEAWACGWLQTLVALL
jgi:hypothetical protein